MAQLYSLYRVHRGKKTLLATGERPKVRKRMAQLRKDSHTIKGQGAAYVVELAGAEAEKYRKPPDNHKRSGGDAVTPRRTKWDAKG